VSRPLPPPPSCLPLGATPYVCSHPRAVPLEATSPALTPPATLGEDRLREYDVATPLRRDALITGGLPVAVAPPRGHLVPAVDDESGARQDDAIRRMVVERVVLSKPDLYFYWANLDRTGVQDGTITKVGAAGWHVVTYGLTMTSRRRASPVVPRSHPPPTPPPPPAWQVQWAEGMRTILGLDLPWLSLAASLAEADDKGRINYSHFLDRCVCAGEAGGRRGAGVCAELQHSSARLPPLAGTASPCATRTSCGWRASCSGCASACLPLATPWRRPTATST
jgi:hypothetical protein